MIKTLEELHDYVNKFHIAGRLDGVEGRIAIRGQRSAGLSYKDDRQRWASKAIEPADLDRLEVGLGEDRWVLLAEFDEAETARIIERFTALQGYETALRNYVRAAEHLRESHAEMDPADQRALQLPVLCAFDPEHVVKHREAVKGELP